MHRHLSAFLPLLMAGCTLFGTGPSDDVSDLTDARSRWESLGWENYDLRLTRGCFCVGAGEYDLWVRDADLAAVWPAGESSTDVRPDAWEFFPTVDDLFDLVEQAQTEADDVSVTYDEHGWPKTIDIDWIANAVDDEISYQVESVTETEPGDAVTMAPDDTYSHAGITVRFDEVTGDSRCPTLVDCFWAGQATAHFTVIPTGELSYTVDLVDLPAFEQDKRTADLGSLRMTLLVIEPYPESPDEPIAAADYRARVLFESL